MFLCQTSSRHRSPWSLSCLMPESSHGVWRQSTRPQEDKPPCPSIDPCPPVLCCPPLPFVKPKGPRSIEKARSPFPHASNLHPLRSSPLSALSFQPRMFASSLSLGVRHAHADPLLDMAGLPDALSGLSIAVERVRVSPLHFSQSFLTRQHRPGPPARHHLIQPSPFLPSNRGVFHVALRRLSANVHGQRRPSCKPRANGQRLICAPSFLRELRISVQSFSNRLAPPPPLAAATSPLHLLFLSRGKGRRVAVLVRSKVAKELRARSAAGGVRIGRGDERGGACEVRR